MSAIHDIIGHQKQYFHTGKTLDYEFRLRRLCQLEHVIHKYKESIAQALKKDLDEAKKSGDKDAISTAKEALNGNENAQKLQENRTAYENTLKEAANFYIKNGSGHPGDKSTPEERKEKLNKHLEQYNPKEFFSKDKDGKPLELANKKDLINKYQFAHRVLQNRGNGK